MMREKLYMTRSVCPVCLKEVYADVVCYDDGIYMDKTCGEHGKFHTLIWADSKEAYFRWLEYGGIRCEELPQNEEEVEKERNGLQFSDCACQQPSSTALMTTNRCNMNCPVCFTRDKKEPLYEPRLEECERLMRVYRRTAGEDALIEFCGGEPTVRSDILKLSELAKQIGFDYIQLNTNGIRLAESADFCRQLKTAGITTVYLGFDGVTEKPYYAKYGRNLLDIKKQAVANCASAELAVVLVTCIIPGENDVELGDIVEFAKANMPAVKGIYLQPISYFGIYPEDRIRRITIPDVIRKLEEQVPEISVSDFSPGSYEHAQCSFNACYLLDKKGKLSPLTHFQKCGESPRTVGEIRGKLRKTWRYSPVKMLTIGGMAFQDSWNIDLGRIRKCSIQIIQKDGKLIPLCSKFLSGCNGSRIFPGIG